MSMHGNQPLSGEQYRLLAEINQNIIKHDRMLSAANELNGFLKQARFRDEGAMASITGLTGAGKTTLLDFCFKRGVHLPTGMRALIMSLPQTCSVKNVTQTMSVELGDPIRKGTAIELDQRNAKILEASEIDIVVFDECQHLVGQSNARVIYETADWLKARSNELKIPFILVGLPRMEKIFLENEQLDRRVTSKIRLSPFSWSNKEEREYSMMFLMALNEELPMENPDQSALLDEGVARMIIQSTGGLVGYVSRLLTKSVELMMKGRKNTLCKKHIEKAFSELGGPTNLAAELQDQKGYF